MFVKNVILYVFLGVFHGAEFKFTYRNTWNFAVHPFLEYGTRPRGTCMAKNAPKMPIFPKKTFFGP